MLYRALLPSFGASSASSDRRQAPSAPPFCTISNLNTAYARCPALHNSGDRVCSTGSISGHSAPSSAAYTASCSSPLPTHASGRILVAMSATPTGGCVAMRRSSGWSKICHCRRRAGRPAPIPTPAVPRSLRPLLELPLPLPADLGELDLLVPVLCAFPLELELELELGCCRVAAEQPRKRRWQTGQTPGIFGRLGPSAGWLARKMEIPVLEAPVPRFEYAVLNADALLDADGEAEENDAPTALRSAGSRVRRQSCASHRHPHSSAGSSLRCLGGATEAVEAVEAPAEMAGGGHRWRFIGKYLHWNPRIKELARAYLRRAFGVAPGAPLSPVRAFVLLPLLILYSTAPPSTSGAAISQGGARPRSPWTSASPPLSTYAWRVEEVRESYSARGASRCSAWCSRATRRMRRGGREVVAYGWHRVDRSTTVETHSQRWKQ
ncbi:hypothetical protein B0H14DRAFT_3600957 [Mycena olivaceomarginata]|nr:hypothetical protein B0H14DRAFT_3600957 [Mycena olivaceomarginata]